jgi:hypothetical protein
VVVDYEAAPGTYILLTVVTQNASPAEAVLAAPQNGRRLQLLSLPLEFGTTLKTAAFSLSATASATDPTPRYLRIYGFGCGPRAVGSVAIDLLRFGPQEVSAAQPETQFGFHTHTTFDKMKAISSTIRKSTGVWPRVRALTTDGTQKKRRPGRSSFACGAG